MKFRGISNLLLVAGAMLVATSAALRLSPHNGASSLPWLSASENPIDLGSIDHGADDVVQRVVYTLDNLTDRALKVYKVSVSCGCTSSILRHSEVPPRGSIDLEVLWDTSGQAGPSKTSLFVWYGLKSEASPEIRTARLDMQCNIIATLRVKPTTLRFSKGVASELSVHLEGTRAAAARFDSAVTNCPGALVELDRDNSVINVRYRPDVPMFSDHYEVSATTNDITQPVIRIPILITKQ